MSQIQQFSHSPFSIQQQIVVSPFSQIYPQQFHIDQSLPYRLPFYAVVLAMSGGMLFELDFTDHHIGAGELLLLPPNKVLKLKSSSDWEAMVLRFTPEILSPTGINPHDDKLFADIKRLPLKLSITPAQQTDLAMLMQQIKGWQNTLEPSPEQQNLLRYQLYSLLNLLVIFGQEQLIRTESKRIKRFRRFENLLENLFTRQHRLADYARQLACTERSLTLASLEVTGFPAKTIISDRLALEAKRLLVYTTSPIAQIADQLGFDDVANFSRFFKKRTGETPLKFRKMRKR
ncbi:AraC family transcriptional regulator [Pasteurellaceae bacterium LIM206]|nr:AraC family transcriptional regulator [Pasteurellaceae bacterium LIM206]